MTAVSQSAQSRCMGRVKRLGESVLKAGGAAGVVMVSALLWLVTSTSASYTTQGGWSNGWPGSNGTTTATYMLLDYSQGFRRRGMLGALVRMVVPAEEVRIWMGWAVWVALYLLAAIAASVVVQKLIRRSLGRGLALLAVLASPYGLGHLASDTSFSGPLTVGLAAATILLASGAARADIWVALILAIAVLLHEQTVLFVAPVAIAALGAAGRRLMTRILVVLPGVLAFLAVDVLGAETGAQRMLSAGRFPYEESVGYFLDRYGSFTNVFKANEGWYNVSGYAAPIVGSGIVMALILCIAVLHFDRTKTPHMELIVLVLGTVALCAVTVDWPRFWCLTLTIATLLLAVEHTDFKPRAIPYLKRAAGVVAVMVGVLSITSVHYMDSAVGAYPLNNQLGIRTPYTKDMERDARVSATTETGVGESSTQPSAPGS